MVSSKGIDLHRFRRASENQKDAELRWQAGRILANEGATGEARRLFHAALEADPAYLPAHLELARLARSPAERRAYLRQVLALDPTHPEALDGLGVAAPARNEGAISQPQSHPSRRPDRPGDRQRRTSRLWVLVALNVAAALLLVALLLWGPADNGLAWLFPSAALSAPSTRTPDEIAARFVPQLEAALTGEDWDRALDIIEIMQSVDPAGQEIQRWAPLVHLHIGQDLVQGYRFREALTQFDQAVSWAPQDFEAGRWQQVTRAYLDGETAASGKDWTTAIEAWLPAHEQFPEYADLGGRLAEAYRQQAQVTIDEADWDAAIASLSDGHQRFPDDSGLTQLLATAYRQRGIVWQQEGKLQKAKADLEAALALVPDDEAQKHYDQVMDILFPTKRIDINISTQRLEAWKGDTLIYSYPVSTGLPGQDTATGHYEVLDKIPMAYSSIWRLKMPYWLGIYYVGNVENGIHALPIRPDGSIMWAGLLGQRASYGCVILSNEAAQLLYDWAEVGTKVDIHY